MLLLSRVTFYTGLTSLALLATALPSNEAATKPPAFFLAGDSTTAAQSPGGGGVINPS